MNERYQIATYRAKNRISTDKGKIEKQSKGIKEIWHAHFGFQTHWGNRQRFEDLNVPIFSKLASRRDYYRCQKYP